MDTNITRDNLTQDNLEDIGENISGVFDAVIGISGLSPQTNITNINDIPDVDTLSRVVLASVKSFAETPVEGRAVVTLLRHVFTNADDKFDQFFDTAEAEILIMRRHRNEDEAQVFHKHAVDVIRSAAAKALPITSDLLNAFL